jgi:hypothetical protein
MAMGHGALAPIQNQHAGVVPSRRRRLGDAFLGQRVVVVIQTEHEPGVLTKKYRLAGTVSGKIALHEMVTGVNQIFLRISVPDAPMSVRCAKIGDPDETARGKVGGKNTDPIGEWGGRGSRFSCHRPKVRN